MVLEATMICVDNSEWMRNGDYSPTRFLAQADAVNLICGAKTQSNPENTVGVLTMAGKGVRVLVTPTSDLGKILACMHGLDIGGEMNLAAGIQIAQLALKHRQNKKQQQRIIVFVGGPVKYDKKVLEMIGRKLKKNSVALDVVNFGEEDDDKTEKLQALVSAVNNDSSHIVHVPAGANALSDVLISTPIFTGDGEGGSGFAAAAAAAAAGGVSGFDFDVDPNVDPELALALRVSMEEERARQEEAAKKAAEEGSQSDKTGEQASTSQDVTMGGTAAPPASETENKAVDLMIRKFEDFPDDVIEEIILRLPVEALVQIIPYLGLNKLSYLTLKHLQIHSPKNSSMGYMLEIQTETSSRYVIYSSQKKEVRVVNQNKERDAHMLFVGTSNGLICDSTIYFPLSEIVLKVMNPVLGEKDFIPQPSLPLNLDFLDVFGFGCMGLSVEFKIVRLVQTQKFRGVELYNSKERKWAQLDIPWPVYCSNRVALMQSPLNPLKITMEISSIVIGSKLHWLVKEEGHNWFRGVIAFDLVREEFEVVKSFSSKHVPEGSRIRLGLFKGQIAAAKENESGGFEICLINRDSEEWKMCEGGYPLQPVASNGAQNSEIYGPYPHMETLILSSKRMSSVIAALQ